MPHSNNASLKGILIHCHAPAHQPAQSLYYNDDWTNPSVIGFLDTQCQLIALSTINYLSEFPSFLAVRGVAENAEVIAFSLRQC